MFNYKPEKQLELLEQSLTLDYSMFNYKHYLTKKSLFQHLTLDYSMFNYKQMVIILYMPI